MERPRLRVGPQVTPALLETIAGFHGAVDSETGHLICHGYTLRPAVLEVGNEPLPVLIIDECVAYTAGADVEKLVGIAEKVEEVRFERDVVEAGGVRVASPWVATVIGLARDAQGLPVIYKLEVSTEKGVRPALLLVYETGEAKQAFMVMDCRVEQRRGAPVTHV